MLMHLEKLCPFKTHKMKNRNHVHWRNLGKDTGHQLSKMNISHAYKYAEYMNIIVIPVNYVDTTLVQITCQIGRTTRSINSMSIKQPSVTGFT